MPDLNVTFKGKVASSTVLQDLKTRINNVFSAAKGSTVISATSPHPNDLLTFSSLNETYTAARTAIFDLTGNSSFCTYSLGNFQNALIAGINGMGITERTVGELEGLCVAHDSGHNGVFCPSNFTAVIQESCPTNFSAVHASGAGVSVPASGSCAAHNAPFFVVGNRGNKSRGGNRGNNSRHHTYTYNQFHGSGSGFSSKKVTVFSSHFKNNYSSFAANSNNFSGFFGANFGNNHSGNNSFTPATTRYDNNGSNSTNRSAYTPQQEVCGTHNSSDHGTNDYTCYVVHGAYTVEGA